MYVCCLSMNYEFKYNYFVYFVIRILFCKITRTMSIQFGGRLQIPRTIQIMLKSGMLSDKNPCSLLLDMTDFKRRLNAVHQAFPEPFFKHCFAAKANPMKYILQTVTSLGGGVECATAGEVFLLPVFFYECYRSTRPCIPVVLMIKYRITVLCDC